jgi:hypothetical protein
MNKYLLAGLVLTLLTTGNIAFQLYQGANASLARPRKSDPARVKLPDRLSGADVGRVKRPHSADPLRFVADRPAEGEDAELLLARVAHDAGVYLLNRARRTPGNTALLRQAAQHLRACLAHEGTVREAGTLFSQARSKLKRTEQMLARLERADKSPSAAVRPAPRAKPAPVLRSAAIKAPAKAAEEDRRTEADPEERTPDTRSAKVVGPDGVLYERAKEKP